MRRHSIRVPHRRNRHVLVRECFHARFRIPPIAAGRVSTVERATIQTERRRFANDSEPAPIYDWRYQRIASTEGEANKVTPRMPRFRSTAHGLRNEPAE